jgi:uncharacterized repeat protein (TIGR01451 family)
MRMLTSLTAFLLVVSISAHAADAVEVRNIAEVEVEVVDSKGNKTLERQPVVKAVPGTEVIYTTTYKNLIAKPVGNIVINNPVPNNTAYKSGSATGANTDITFSVDGGKRFATPDKLTVKDKDGKDRPALASEYTHIRWAHKGELAAGKSGEVSFRAVIK